MACGRCKIEDGPLWGLAASVQVRGTESTMGDTESTVGDIEVTLRERE